MTNGKVRWVKLFKKILRNRKLLLFFWYFNSFILLLLVIVLSVFSLSNIFYISIPFSAIILLIPIHIQNKNHFHLLYKDLPDNLRKEYVEIVNCITSNNLFVQTTSIFHINQQSKNFIKKIWLHEDEKNKTTFM